MNRQSNTIETAVAALCPLVQSKIDERGTTKLNNEELWFELAGCILGSQVPFELAAAACAQLKSKRLLPLVSVNGHASKLESRLVKALSEPLVVGASRRRYRFPQLRARQIVRGAQNLELEAISLSEIVYERRSPRERRSDLIRLLPGLGPKQSSMFLRNARSTDDLAVLDAHVLRFMRTARLISVRLPAPSGLKQYEAMEEILRRYAHRVGYSLACLDWAIWTVMRVASRERRK